jgi:5-methylcytosine-specific restriction endonuclease McrA
MTSALRPGGSTNKWRQLRVQILARDNSICWLCGGAGADSVDHLIARDDGGTDAADNLRAAHVGCNARRGKATIPTVTPSRVW